MSYLNYSNPDIILAQIGFVPYLVETPIEYEKLTKEIQKRVDGDPRGKRGTKGVVWNSSINQ